jgi:hypothetical protein
MTRLALVPASDEKLAPIERLRREVGDDLDLPRDAA